MQLTSEEIARLRRLQTAACRSMDLSTQTGGKRPTQSDTLVLWAALFDKDGRFLAYVNDDHLCELMAEVLNALPTLLDIAEAAQGYHQERVRMYEVGDNAQALRSAWSGLESAIKRTA